MPIVLTTNEIVRNPDHAWNDVEGVQYHYPNQYKNKIKPGVEFVYYRGVHRKGGHRADAEYFGRGRIGDIRLDLTTEGEPRPAWFCAIDDYVPFNPPVPAKISGVFFEQIPGNMWRNGVRDLDEHTFASIVAMAGNSLEEAASPALPNEVNDLVAPASKIATRSPGGGYRLSKRAKQIGDWAELAAVAFIRANFQASQICHRAALGETPGWDIDYIDEEGVVQRVEVKGTVGGAFTTVELTARELQSAQAHGEAYWLYLVADCLTGHPRIQRLSNPVACLSGAWTAHPILYRVTLAARA